MAYTNRTLCAEMFLEFFLFLIIFQGGLGCDIVKNRPSFDIDYENNQFLLDGKPFRYVSGSFHYFRAPRQYWRDRLQKMRAAGLNAVSTYVEWSLHQPELNVWVWDGDADIIEFIKIAKEEDLLVILRPGPYICAERDFGGFPYWLLTCVPDIKLRTNDSRYLKYAEEYLNQLLIRVKPFLRGNGGPVIMIQVENEYGSFYACDSDYKNKLKDIIKKHVGNKALLYTTDGSYKEALRCGPIPGVYATVDFGTSSNVTENFEMMREVEPKGPLVNSEFYPGWLSHWEEPFERVDTPNITNILDEMLSVGASVNFYMFYGGTNFAFTSGANIFDNYAPDLTSYDYDAPLTEAGDPTPKYFEIKRIISKYLPIPKLPIPTISLKGEYGSVTLRPVLNLFDEVSRNLYGTKKVQVMTNDPPTFEALGLSNWIVLYETVLPENLRSEDKIQLNAFPKDRALVYADGKFCGTLSRSHRVNSTILDTPKEIKILVENQGRVNFGNIDVEDFKGLFNVSINDAKVKYWNVTGFRFDESMESSLGNMQSTIDETHALISGPQILIGHFEIDGELRDTYLNTANWGKGIAFVNGHNLGRYWPLIGPQLTLYVPAPYLKNGKNLLVLVELEYVPENRKISFQTIPILDYQKKVIKNVKQI